jgi:hypothetical protein
MKVNTMILSYYYSCIHKDDLPKFEKKAKALGAEYQSFPVGLIERNMSVKFTGKDLKDCERKAGLFRKIYQAKREIGPWSKEVR